MLFSILADRSSDRWIPVTPAESFDPGVMSHCTRSHRRWEADVSCCLWPFDAALTGSNLRTAVAWKGFTGDTCYGKWKRLMEGSYLDETKIYEKKTTDERKTGKTPNVLVEGWCSSSVLQCVCVWVGVREFLDDQSVLQHRDGKNNVCVCWPSLWWVHTHTHTHTWDAVPDEGRLETAVLVLDTNIWQLCLRTGSGGPNIGGVVWNPIIVTNVGPATVTSFAAWKKYGDKCLCCLCFVFLRPFYATDIMIIFKYNWC